MNWLPVWALGLEFCSCHGGVVTRYSDSGDARGIFRVLFYDCPGQQCRKIVRV